MLHIQRPLNQDVLSLRVKAVLENGRTVIVPVDIDLATGQVSERGQLSSSLSSFSDQLETEVNGLSAQDSSLIAALENA